MVHTVINATTEDIVCEVITNHSISIEEALILAGAERITEEHPAYNVNECGDYYLDGEEIYVEDLYMLSVKERRYLHEILRSEQQR